jgi:hypothetical protein
MVATSPISNGLESAGADNFALAPPRAVSGPDHRRDADDPVTPQPPRNCSAEKTLVCAVVADQPIGLDVPTDPSQHRASRRREARKVSDCGVGDETYRCLARQVQEVEQSLRCHRFCSSGSR